LAYWARTVDVGRHAIASDPKSRTLAGIFSRTRRRAPSAPIPTIVCLRDIGCRWPLCVAILAVVKTIFGASWNSERRTKAIALYVAAAAKWAWIKLYVTHDPGSVMFAGEAACENTEGFTLNVGRLRVNLCANSV
jgi:hypothetical protein